MSNPYAASLMRRVRPAFFIPSPSDTVESMIVDLYGVQKSDSRLFNKLRDYTMKANPELKSPQTTFGGYIPRTLDFISTDPHHFLCANPVLIEDRIVHATKFGEFSEIDRARNFVPGTRGEREIYGYLAKLSEKFDLAEGSLSAGIGLLATMTGTKNQAIMRQLGVLHEQRRSGTIGRSAFKTAKATLIAQYAKAVGPLAQILHGEKDMLKALHQNQGNGLSPSQQFTKRADHMAHLSKLSTKGGILLSIGGAAFSVAKICTAETIEESNLHIIDAAGNIAGGFLGSKAGSGFITLITGAGPVGWWAAVVVTALTSTHAGDLGSGILRNLFDRFGNRVDLAQVTGLGRLCL